MNVSRRGLIKTIGALGVLGTLGVGRVGAGGGRYFVHGSAPAAAARDHGATILHEYENFPFVAARVPDPSALGRDGRVSHLRADGRVHAFHHREGHGGGPGGGGDDGGDGGSGTTTQQLWWGVDRVDADLAWAAGHTGAGLKVAVLDTGIDGSHPDLTVAGGRNFTSGPSRNWDDKNGHGTHCAGVVAARDNTEGVVGVATDAELYAVKVLDNSGSGYISGIVAGIDWCISNGIDVMSESFGASSGHPDLQTAQDAAAAAGILAVAAAGNEGDTALHYPAAYDSVLSVAATTPHDELSSYSTYGSWVDIAAPGGGEEAGGGSVSAAEAIYSTYKGDSYEYLIGTSMACPHVAGAAAVVWQALGVGATPSDVRGQLLSTAESVDLAPYGGDLLDVAAACGVAS